MATGALGQQLEYITSEVNESLDSVREALVNLFSSLKELVEAPADTTNGEAPTAAAGDSSVTSSPVTVTSCRCALPRILEPLRS